MMRILDISSKDKPPFLEAIEDHGLFFIIHLQGEVSTHALEGNQERMQRVFEKNSLFSKPILCDFGKVTHSDTATLAAIIVRFTQFQKKGGTKLVLFNVVGDLKSLLEIARLEQLFTIRETQAEAIDALIKMK